MSSFVLAALVVVGVAVVLVARCWPEDEDEYLSESGLAHVQQVRHSACGWARFLERR